MLDSINLHELAQRMKRLREANRYRWTMFAALIFIFILLVLVLFRAPPYPSSQPTCNCATTILLDFLPFLSIVGCLIVFSINRRQHRKLITPYLDEVKKLDLPTVSSQWSSPVFATIVIWLIGSILVSLLLTREIPLAFILIFVPYLLFAFLLSWAAAPMRGGDYDLTIERWSRLLNYPLLRGLRPTFSYTISYVFSGRAVESEKAQLQILAVFVNLKYFEAVALNNYATELLYQGRYEEAKRFLELAILIQPEIPAMYEGLASWYLYQGLDANRAVELLEFSFKLPVPFYMSAKTPMRALNLITYAWAKAKLGDISGSKRAMQEALQALDQKDMPYYEMLIYTAGQVELTLGNQAKAADYFKQVMNIDKNGRFSKFARQSLGQST